MADDHPSALPALPAQPERNAPESRRIGRRDAGSLCPGRHAARKRGWIRSRGPRLHDAALHAPALVQPDAKHLPMMTAAQREMIANDYAERAFFVSGVEPGVILSDFEDKAAKVASGALSYEEAQQAIRETLRQQGYRPPATGQGGIQDLSSWVRIQVVMETNAAMAHGYRNWYNWTQDEDTAAFKFYRSQGREDPRYWAERWNRARAGLEEEATEAVSSGFIRGETVGYALASSDIWIRLSRFGTPYPPFDYLSGMNIAPIGAEEARAAGLDVSRVRPAPASFNATLESNAQGVTEANKKKIRGILKDALRVSNESDGNTTFVYTDPNGTRPYTDAELAELLSGDFPEEIPLRQAQAFRLAAAGGAVAGTLASLYLDRLLDRLFSEPEGVWFARPADVAGASSRQFIPVSRKEEGEFTWRLTSGHVKKVEDVAGAIRVELPTPYVLPVKWL
nr:MAG TPA: hypothetical protein [Caudoviricetes sp.]